MILNGVKKLKRVPDGASLGEALEVAAENTQIMAMNLEVYVEEVRRLQTEATEYRAKWTALRDAVNAHLRAPDEGEWLAAMQIMMAAADSEPRNVRSDYGRRRA